MAIRRVFKLVISGPIDKLEIRIPGGTKLAGGLKQEWDFSNNHVGRKSFCGTKYYCYVVNLAQYGMDSILHFCQRRDGNHKLQITDTGMKTLPQIFSEITKAFEVDPMSLEIMRIDLAVDVRGYRVEFFRRRVRVSHKRFSSEYGRFMLERTNVETLYFGKRPNVVRIYDKTAERRAEYQRLVRKAKNPLPTFQARYGHLESEILTRVERQYGGGRIPKQIATLRSLQENILRLNPFGSLQFLPGTISEESVNQLSGDAFIKGQGLLRLVERHGFSGMRRLLDKKTGRNTRRLLAQISNSISLDAACAPPDLNVLFLAGISEQLASV